MVGIGVIPAELRTEPNIRIHAPERITLPFSEFDGGDRRLEARVYLSAGFQVRHEIRRTTLQVSPLGRLAKVWQPNRLKAIRVGPEHGVPFVAATQVFDIWPTPRKWLAPSKTPDLADHYVAPDWILVTRSGTVGNAMITYSAHADIAISDDLLRVEIDEPELRSYVYAFLRTWYGRAMMRGSHYGNVIKHLEVAHLEQIPVPMLDRLLDETHEQVVSVFAARDEAYRLDMASRAKFMEAMQDRHDATGREVYAISTSQIFGGRRRLEAHAHSPASRFVSQVYERNAESVVALGTIAHVYLPGRFKRIYGETGTTYLDSEPIFKINPEMTKFLTSATPVKMGAYLVKRGWLLMACSGQIYGLNGQATIANEWHEGKVVTQHIMRIVPSPEEVRSGYLQTVLSHPTLGKPLVVSRAYGSSVPELAPEDIRQIPIPRLKREVEDEIADAAEQANELRRRADERENGVVTRLEGELKEVLGITLDNRGTVRIRSGSAKTSIRNLA